MTRDLSTLSLDDLLAVNDKLGADTQRCLDSAGAAATAEGRLDQFWVRALVRSFFSQVEAITFQMGSIVVAAHHLGVAVLSDSELGALLESTWELDDTATPRSRTRFIPLDRRLRFTFALFGRVYGLQSALPVSQHGWRDFKRALHLRNQLTHPKNPSSLEITLDEAGAVSTAITWYFNTLRDQASLVNERLRDPVFIAHLRGVPGAQAPPTPPPEENDGA